MSGSVSDVSRGALKSSAQGHDLANYANASVAMFWACFSGLWNTDLGVALAL